jgi:hypothetical protein
MTDTSDFMDDSGVSDSNALFNKFALGVLNLDGPRSEGTNAEISVFRAQN